MKDGVVVERGPTEQIFAAPAAALHPGADGGGVPDRGGAGGGGGRVGAPWSRDWSSLAASRRPPALHGGQGAALVPVEPGAGSGVRDAGCVAVQRRLRAVRSAAWVRTCAAAVRSCNSAPAAGDVGFGRAVPQLVDPGVGAVAQHPQGLQRAADVLVDPGTVAGEGEELLHRRLGGRALGGGGGRAPPAPGRAGGPGATCRRPAPSPSAARRRRAGASRR